MTKLWIDPEGTLHPVGDDLSHEQWANRHKNAALETLLQAGWIRVQMVVPRYLYLDYQLPLTEGQVTSVARLFENQVAVVLVDFGGESMTFADTAEAKRFVLGTT
jgi:hypothetical protein